MFEGFRIKLAAVSLGALVVGGVAGCAAPPPDELGEEGSGGIAQGAAGGGGGGSAADVLADAGPDGTSTPVDPDADATADADANGDQQVASAGNLTGSVLDSGRGAEFGSALSAEDIGYFQQAEISARTAFVSDTITWRNPSNGHAGTITVLGERQVSGQSCRDLLMTATVDGRQNTETATICRVAAGQWTVPA